MIKRSVGANDASTNYYKMIRCFYFKKIVQTQYEKVSYRGKSVTMKAVDTTNDYTKWLIINTQRAQAICTVRFVSLAGAQSFLKHFGVHFRFLIKNN